MLNVNIICVGKQKERYWRDACNEYEKRLRAFCKFSIIEVDEEKTADNPNDSQILHILGCEGKRILRRIGKSAKVIVLCIEARIVSSQELSYIMDTTAIEGISNISFVIGGSWGLSEEVKERGSVKLSMSKMTFPHQLARVMVCEQIYRGFQILSGGKYHK